MIAPHFKNPAQLLRLILAFGFVGFSLSYFMALTAKGSNNVFYLAVALPTFVLALFQYKAVVEVFKSYYWLLAMILILSIMDAEQLKDAKRGFYLILFFIACFFINQDKNKLKNWLLPFGICCLVMFFYITADWVWIWTHTNHWKRYSYWLGEFVHPGFFGMLLCFGLTFLWHFYGATWLTKKYPGSQVTLVLGLLCASLVIGLCAIIFQSRTALLAYGCYFVGFVFARRIYWLGLVAALAITGLIFILNFNDVLANRGFSFRFVIWQEVLRQLVQDCNTFIGCTPDRNILGEFSHPHNVYIAMFYRNGLLGGAIFVVFMIGFFNQAIKMRSQWMVLSLFGWGALLTENNSIFTSPQPFWIYFWLPVFMAVLEIKQNYKSQS